MGSAAGTGFMSRMSRAPGSVPSHVYQPTYTNYGSPMYQAVRGAVQGLGATPQARTFTPQMPTYTRPSIPMQQPSYQIPTGPPPTPQQQITKAFGRLLNMTPAGQAVITGLDMTPTGQALSKILSLNTPPPSPTTGYRVPYMTMAQYEAINKPSSDDGGSVDSSSDGA